MARTKLNQRSANRVEVPMGATGGRTPPSAMTVALLALSIILAVWAAAMLTPFGRVAYVYVFLYAEFYMGVLTLVSLSITVMIGLVATDRLVLSIRQRVLLQSAHRTTGVIAVASLLVHVLTKLAIAHITVLDIFVPFMASFNTLYVGLGTLAGMLMVSVLWTGLARARFAGKGKPWMWRSMHSVAYLAWPIALVHGLAAGRAAATWVIVSYIVCVLFVLVALAVRLSVSLNRRKDFSSTATGNLKPVGSLVPTQSAPAKKKPSRRRDPEPARAPAAVETWSPAAAPVSPAVAAQVSAPARPVSSMPTSSMPASGMPVSGPAYADGYGHRYADDDAPRGRRARAEGYGEVTGRISRRALEEEEQRYAEPRGRRYAEPDEPRGHRYAEPDEPRGRRYADDPYADSPRPRGRFADDTGDAPRARRDRGADVDRADSGRHSRSEFVDLAAPAADPWQADPNYLEPDDTPTLVDMAARRARRQDRPEPARASRGARRNRARTTDDALDDQQYWRQLRGEAQ
jgi:hypothetical protein